MAQTGMVKWYNSRLGYGFITVSGSDDLFVHHSRVEDGDALVQGEHVEFEVEEGPHGPMAARVGHAG
ncbi:MAG: cold shock domain-containing protein [Candidatus Latescibacterota bacterium]|jgi:CspA family cold shock protein